MSEEIKTLRQELLGIDQSHVLRFFDRLNNLGREKLHRQLAALDLGEIDELAEMHVRHKSTIPLPTRIEPVKTYPRQAGPSQEKLYADAMKRGHELLREGKVAAFLVAGGQGTRLGYDGPKGEFPVTPIKHKPLFQVFAEQLLAWSRDSGKAIPWYIMTSDVNDAATRAFFKKHNYFGYDPKDVFFFQQGMMPAFSMAGKMLLAAKDSLALSPDGHGGSLRALHKSGALADMRKRGVEHLSYFQVDNPLVHCIDPLFLGLHDLTGSEMSSKTIPKANAAGKSRQFRHRRRRVAGDRIQRSARNSWRCRRMRMAAAIQRRLDRDSCPAGVVHRAAERGRAAGTALASRGEESSVRRRTWRRGETDKPNAVKLEQFVFDAIPLAKNAIVYATDRAEEFSPVKNAEGDDSPATCRRDQIRRGARWLRKANIAVPEMNGEPDAVLEISPLFATSGEQLAKRSIAKRQIAPGESVYFGEG